jgi:hypothetical protein
LDVVAKALATELEQRQRAKAPKNVIDLDERRKEPR